MPDKTAIATFRRVLTSADVLAAREERQAAAKVADGCSIDHLQPRTRCRATGVLRSVVFRPRSDTQALEADLYDGSGSLALVWLGRRAIGGIEPGRRLIVEGMVSVNNTRLTMFNPRYELLPGVGA